MKIKKYHKYWLPMMAVLFFVGIAIFNYYYQNDKSVFMITGAIFASLLLIANKKDRQLAIFVGFVSAIVDFVYEFIGITNGGWDYSYSIMRIFNVPIELPIIYFSLGVIITFVVKYMDKHLN